MPLLKQATAELHVGAERALQFGAALASLPAYRSKLAQFYGFYRPLEAQIYGTPGIEAIDFKGLERVKWPRIERDLQSLGWTTVDIDRLPRCNFVPLVRDLGDVLGCSYVLEGATLGGRIIAREVHSRLELSPENGCAFFSGYGDSQTGPMWRRFADAATQFVLANPGSEDAVVAAAVATFEQFIAWMERGPKTCDGQALLATE